MKLTKDTFLIAIILILLGLIALQRLIKPKPEVITETVHHYKTDSLYKDKYFELKKKLDKPIPPKIITRWRTPEPADSVIIEHIPDSLILYINNLKERIAISQGFLINYPNNPKLIELFLNNKSIELSFYGKDNFIDTYTYPIYLDNFEYQWYDNQMHSSEYHKKKEKSKLDFKRLYLTTGYDYLNKYNTLGLDYSLEVGRIKVMADTKLLLQKKSENIEANIGIGYKLLK